MLKAAKAVVTKLVIHILCTAQLSQIGYKLHLVLCIELLNIDIFPIYLYTGWPLNTVTKQLLNNFKNK